MNDVNFSVSDLENKRKSLLEEVDKISKIRKTGIFESIKKCCDNRISGIYLQLDEINKQYEKARQRKVEK